MGLAVFASEAAPRDPALKAARRGLHCQSCLDGTHRCKVMIPLAWLAEVEPGCPERCICKPCNGGRYDKRRSSSSGLRVAQTRPPRKPRGVTGRNGQRAGTTAWDDDRLRELITLFDSGLTSRQVAEKLGSEMSVCRFYKRQAVKKGIQPSSS